MGAAAIAATAAVVLAPSAGASDAQIKASFRTGVKIINTEKVRALSTDLLVVKTMLSTRSPSTAKGRVAKTFALQGFGYMIKAAAAQADAADLIAAGDFDAAQRKLDLVEKTQPAGVKLLRKAAAQLGLKVKLPG
jgi:hypothetical protein